MASTTQRQEVAMGQPSHRDPGPFYDENIRAVERQWAIGERTPPEAFRDGWPVRFRLAGPTVSTMPNPTDNHDPQREIIKGLTLISVLLFLVAVMLAAIVFGLAEITVVAGD
jgi:hypothetical protein